MSEAAKRPVSDLDEILADTSRIEAALRDAVRGALRDHKQAGNPIAVWREGQVVWLPPDQIPVEASADLEPKP